MHQYHLSASFKSCNKLFVELMNQSTHVTVWVVGIMITT
jgi:hypothetical protein